MSKAQEYKGKEITLFFDASLCIHARNCVLTLPQVFRANVEGPWIFPDSADAEEIAALAHNCPSGAIHYERHDQEKQETAPEVNTARVWENGPVAVHADLHIEGHAPCTRAVLCRCGASKNKPLCDGSHKAIDFTATGEPPSQETEPLKERGGILTATPLPDGPVLLKGNVEILSGTGRAIQRAQEAALCRCGASKNKPYCDGSHVAAGFKAP